MWDNRLFSQGAAFRTHYIASGTPPRCLNDPGSWANVSTALYEAGSMQKRRIVRCCLARPNNILLLIIPHRKQKLNPPLSTCFKASRGDAQYAVPVAHTFVLIRRRGRASDVLPVRLF